MGRLLSDREKSRSPWRDHSVEHLRPDLELLASALAGHRVSVRWSKVREGGWLNQLIASPQVALPKGVNQPDEWLRSWVQWRALIHWVQIRGVSIEPAQMYREIESEFPGARATLQRWESQAGGMLPLPLHRERLAGGAEEQAQAAAPSVDPKESENSESTPKPSVALLNTVSQPEVVNLKKEEENPLVHYFEKLLTADEHQGGSKSLDGTDEMSLHQEALKELTLRKVVRTQQTTDSWVESDSLRLADFVNSTNEEVETIERQFLYPEWFERDRGYRDGHCRLRESTIKVVPVDSTATTQGAEARWLRKALMQVMVDEVPRSRQFEGPELDLDMLVRAQGERLAARRARNPVTQERRVYVNRRPLERDIALLVLVDTSMSTDGYIKNRHIIAMIREALDQLGGVFDAFSGQIAFAGFHGNTRLDCRFEWIKRFEESWELGRRRVLSIRPSGYTRIGAALRHARVVAEEVQARRKSIVLLSDSKPTDYDAYEGAHGVCDVRRAVSEIYDAGIQFRALSFSQEKKIHLSEMYGAGGFERAQSPGEVLLALGRWILKQMR